MAQLLNLPTELRLCIWDLAIPAYGADDGVVDACRCPRPEEKREYEPSEDGDWECFGRAHLRRFVLDLPAPIIACRQTYNESLPIVQRRRKQHHQHQHHQRLRVGSLRCLGTLLRYLPAQHPDSIHICLGAAPVSSLGGGGRHNLLAMQRQASLIRSTVQPLAVRYGLGMKTIKVRLVVNNTAKWEGFEISMVEEQQQQQQTAEPPPPPTTTTT